MQNAKRRQGSIRLAVRIHANVFYKHTTKRVNGKRERKSEKMYPARTTLAKLEEWESVKKKSGPIIQTPTGSLEPDGVTWIQ
jgi:hypothetical protein